MKLALFLPENAMPSMGARSVSASLKAAGHSTRLLFLSKEFDDPETGAELAAIDDWLASERPDLVGISLMSNHLQRAIGLTHRVQHVHSLRVIWGGVHPSSDPEGCLRHADAVCVGEGEQAMVELAERVDAGSGLGGVPGIWTRASQPGDRRPPAPKIADLDRLPFPDHERKDHFILHQGAIRPMSDEVMRQYLYACNGTHFVFTSRGCPRRCAYCCNELLQGLSPGPKIRRRSVENVLREVKDALGRYGFISSFAFWDDSFLTCSRSWLEEFCARYSTEVGLPFFCNLHPEEVTESRLKLLVDAGLVGVQMGLQTGSDRINREVYDRNSTGAAFERAARLLHGYRERILDRHYHVIVDSPWETDEDRARTVRLLARIDRPFYLSRCALTFYPGTRLHVRALEEGILEEGSNPVYVREYFTHRRTFLTLLMRVTPVAPPWLVKALLAWRGSALVRLAFFAGYYGLFCTRYRLWNKWRLRRKRHSLAPVVSRSAPGRQALLRAAIEYRPL